MRKHDSDKESAREQLYKTSINLGLGYAGQHESHRLEDIEQHFVIVAKQQLT